MLRKAFEKEVATWVVLEKHPNIVRCFLMDILDDQPFMVLEWIAGEEERGADLRGWLRYVPLDLHLSLEIAIDIFGDPIAREDDPEQAIRAGLEILDLTQKIAGKIERDWDIENFQMRIRQSFIENKSPNPSTSWQGQRHGWHLKRNHPRQSTLHTFQ